MSDKTAATMDKIVNLCKARGIIFPGSEIYGGMGNTWDYGPVGVEIKNNVKRAWWKKFVQESDNSFGVDAAILMNSRVWRRAGTPRLLQTPKWTARSARRVSARITSSKTIPREKSIPTFYPTRRWRRTLPSTRWLAPTAASTTGRPYAPLT